VTDRYLGIWAALVEVFPQTDELRCWNHRLVNLIDQLANCDLRGSPERCPDAPLL
jgi:transposase-like protein